MYQYSICIGTALQLPLYSKFYGTTAIGLGMPHNQPNPHTAPEQTVFFVPEQAAP